MMSLTNMKIWTLKNSNDLAYPYNSLAFCLSSLSSDSISASRTGNALPETVLPGGSSPFCRERISFLGTKGILCEDVNKEDTESISSLSSGRCLENWKITGNAKIFDSKDPSLRKVKRAKEKSMNVQIEKL